MLMKLIDDIFALIGAVFSLLLVVIIGTLAYYHFPVTTCIVGGIIGIGLLCSFIASLDISFSDTQAEKTGEIIAISIILVAIGFAFYYFPKTTAVFLLLIALGFVAERIEKRKNTNKAA